MTSTEPRPKLWTGPRLVAAGVALALLLLAARFGPALLPRARSSSTSAPPPSAGALRPIQSIEDRIAQSLAGFLVDEPPPGEALSPKLRYEHPWPVWLFLLLGLGGIAAIAWLYHSDGTSPPSTKALLAAIRSTLLLIAILLLSEVVLAVERTGLPTFVILVDDSASGQIVDPYETPAIQDQASQLARIAAREKSDRMALALGWLLRDDARFVSRLAEQQKVKLYRASSSAVPVAEIERPEQTKAAIERLRTLEPTGEHSRLGESVTQVLAELRGSPPTAVLLLSDGQTTDGPKLFEAAEEARKLAVPLFTVGLGDDRPARDLALSDLQVDEVAFVNDIVRFQARLTARGFDTNAAPGQATIQLSRRRAGSSGPDDLEALESIRVPIPSDGQPQRVEVSYRPIAKGQTTFVLDVLPAEREIMRDNNRIEREVDIRDERLKVLFVEGEPRWEYRYLKTYLERDSTVDLSVVLQSSDERFADQDRSAIASFPPGKDGPDGLYSYDVVVLGDVDPAFLNAQQMRDLVEFVDKKGGGLMLVAGELFNPLALKGKPLEPLLPIRLDEARNPSVTGAPVDAFHPQLTPEGRSSPIFRLGDDEAASIDIWDRLPPSLWYFEAPRLQPAAVVLAEHPEKRGADGKLPLLVYHYSGGGKVLFSAIDDTWRWRLRIGDRYFGRYWVQTLRFLARSKLLGERQVEIVTDRHRYPRSIPVRVNVRFLNPNTVGAARAISVQLRKDNAAVRPITLRPAPGPAAQAVYEASLSALAEGRYTLEYIPPGANDNTKVTAAFQVDPPAGEFARIEMNREELAAAARLTGGHFFAWHEQSRRVDPRAPQPQPASSPSPDESTTGTSPGATAERTLSDLLPVPQKVQLDADPPIPLWNTWPLLVLFLLLITTEWIIRKRVQLV